MQLRCRPCSSTLQEYLLASTASIAPIASVGDGNGDSVDVKGDVDVIVDSVVSVVVGSISAVFGPSIVPPFLIA